MKSVMPPMLGADHTEMLQHRIRAITQVRSHGTQKPPAMPRAVQAQPTQGGALVTWHLPPRYDDVTGYRIYTDSEKNLSIQIKDRGTRQMFVPLPAGTTPPTSNVFISVVNGFRESARVQIQTASQASSVTPTLTLPPIGFLEEFSGGLDKTQAGKPSGKKTA